jgi:Fe2+ transport system protein FeoA
MNPASTSSIPLSALPKGACGLVSEVRNPDELARLQSMGVCIGRRLEVIQTGDPLIFRVFGSRIGLSARMAEHIQVEPCARAPRCWEASA